MSNSSNDSGVAVRDDLIAQLKEHHTKTLQSLLTTEQLEIIFGEAQVNPDDAVWPLGEDEVVKAVQRFLKERDELVKEIECRKSHTDTEIAELKAEVKSLKEERDTSLTILQEANSEVLADVKGGLTKAKLKAEVKSLKEELDVWVNPTGEVVMNQEGMMLYESTQEEIAELKEEVKSQDETIKYGRERLTGMISRLVDATELLNTLGYTFDEDDETWAEKDKWCRWTEKVVIQDIKQDHQETLDEIREYLGRFGGDEVEVFDKIVKGEEEEKVEELTEEQKKNKEFLEKLFEESDEE